ALEGAEGDFFFPALRFLPAEIKRQSNQEAGDGADVERSAPSVSGPERAADDDQLARLAVREKANPRRGAHVEDEEDGGERAQRSVRGVELLLDQRLHAEEDVAVDVVEEVEPGQQGKSEHRTQSARRHALPASILIVDVCGTW